MNATFRFLPSASSPSLCCITFSKEVAFLHFLSFLNSRRRLIQVSWLVLMNLVSINFQIIFKRNTTLFAHHGRNEHEFHLHQQTQPHHHLQQWIWIRASRAALPSRPVPTIGTSGRIKRNSLALHVRSHQRTVGIIMLQERNQRSTQTNDLVRRNVHVFHFIFIKDREVTCFTANNLIFSEIAFLVQWRICLGDLRKIFFFCT
jgi:hypothetical protein